MSGIFNEVNTRRATAGEEIKKMITLFEVGVKRSFSSIINYLLAGKSADMSKIKSTKERQVMVVNLRRLQKLQLGQLTIEMIWQLV